MIHNPTVNYCGLTIILDHPSRFDKDSGRLISGYAGEYFDNFLHPINRFECQIRTLDEPAAILSDTIVILGLGEGCIGNLCSKEFSLNEIRGTPLSYQGRPLIMTYSPQDAMDRKEYYSAEEELMEGTAETESNIKGHGKTRRRNWRWWMMKDIGRAVKLLKPSEEKYKYYPHIIIKPNADELNTLIWNLKNIKDKELYLDIETDKNKRLTCLGLGINSKIDYVNLMQNVWVIPFKQYNNTFAYTHLEYCQFIQALVIAMNSNTCVLHNSMFDLFILCYFYKIPFPKKIFDTMLSWHRCYPELEKSLGHLMSYFTLDPYHKSEGVFNPTSAQQDQQLWNYNAKDILGLMNIHKPLEEEINKLKVQDSVTFVNSMINPYLRMMFHGMRLNIPAMLERFKELDFKRDQLDRCLNIVTNQKLNPRSPKQVKNYLYGKLALDCPNEKAPTNEKTLLKLLTDRNIPSVRIILESRGTGKTASALKFNLYKRPNDLDYSRLTTAYNLAGTDTFRLSSKSLLKFSPDKGMGSNVQNWDKRQRDLVIADKNKILIQIDQAGAEALIVAYLCRNGNFRALFLNGIKSHVFVGLHVFKSAWRKRLPPDKVQSIDDLCKLSPDKLRLHPDFKAVESLIKESDNWEAKERYYFIAKMICHAANYGMRAPTFQMNVLQKSDGAVVLSVKECKLFLGLYHSLFPEIEQWHCDIRRELQTSRVLYNLFGEARRFMEPVGEDLWKQGYAFIPQSTVGEITNRAVVAIQEEIDGGFAPAAELELLQNGHDSILSQCNIGYERDCIHMMRRYMEPELTSHRGEKFKMKTEVAIGYNWGPYKVVKNILGMKEYTNAA